MKILTFRGTEVHAIPSFLILIGLFVLLALERGQPWQEAALWIPVIFLSVLFHEAGHAAANAALGLGPSLIVLGGYGGFTVNREKRKAWQDVVVSVAGPIFSFILAGLVFVLKSQFEFVERDPMLASLIPLLLVANIVWGIFNLLPVFPMDGGQALYGVVRYLAKPRSALLISIWSSMILGGGLLVLGLLSGQFFVSIILAFLLYQNYQRLQMMG
ncbi:MAG: M50 family metallopeptidase [Thermoanaerobaculia bacterium]|nr:M50 family metallopeptidase [Thermoanaerobaculia bacterium]